MAGRLWCGYACPQTVYTEMFLWVERHTEGDRSARMRLDAAPWSVQKLARKGSKQVVVAGSIGLYTGFTFVGYFTPIHTLAAEAAALSFSPWEWFWVLFYGFATYGNAGYLREQVCKYMCPYARFQSALIDMDSLVIAYDAGARRAARLALAQGRPEGPGPGRLHRLHPVRAGLPDRHRHPPRPAERMHRLRRLHRRLRRRHGQDGLCPGTDPLLHRATPSSRPGRARRCCAASGARGC